MKTTVAYCHGKKSSVHHQSDSTIRKTNEKKGGEGGGTNIELWICHLKRTRIKKLLFYIGFLELNMILFSLKTFFYTFFHF